MAEASAIYLCALRRGLLAAQSAGLELGTDIGPSFTTALLVPAVLLLLIAGVLVLARRLRAGALPDGGGDDSLRLRDTLTIGPQQRLLSVEWEGTRLLLAQNPDGVELLSSDLVRSRTSRPTEDARVDHTPSDSDSRPEPQRTFAEVMRSMRDATPNIGRETKLGTSAVAAEAAGDGVNADMEEWHV